MMEIHIDQERPPAIQKTTLRYFSKNWKKSTQDRHSSSKLGWLAEWKRGGWYEKSEGSRALKFKSFLYDKHAALLEPVKRKEELCREERGSCSTLPWRTTWDLGTGHNRGYDQPWKLTLQTGLVTHRYHADVQLRNLNSGPNLGWDSFCFHARIWLKLLYFQGLLHKNTKNDVFKMGLWWDRGRASPGRVNFWSTQVCTLEHILSAIAAAVAGWGEKHCGIPNWPKSTQFTSDVYLIKLVEQVVPICGNLEGCGLFAYLELEQNCWWLRTQVLTSDLTFTVVYREDCKHMKILLLSFVLHLLKSPHVRNWRQRATHCIAGSLW